MPDDDICAAARNRHLCAHIENRNQVARRRGDGGSLFRRQQEEKEGEKEILGAAAVLFLSTLPGQREGEGDREKLRAEALQRLVRNFAFRVPKRKTRVYICTYTYVRMCVFFLSISHCLFYIALFFTVRERLRERQDVRRSFTF